MKTIAFFAFLPLFLTINFGGADISVVSPSAAELLQITDEPPEMIKALQVKKKWIAKFRKNAPVDHFTISEKGVLRPMDKYRIIKMKDGSLVIAHKLEVGEIYKLNLDKYPSLDNVQAPAIVVCICAENYREKCNTIEFPKTGKGETAKYCAGRCDCRAVIRYVNIPEYFDRWQNDGGWNDF
ncbi:hypothetical protein CEQ90_16185 [Lewinellaceae bacterium SD302]|nr:hypothetical protein CEQ90_16185 [Lewinellaceae bacterium SD302]